MTQISRGASPTVSGLVPELTSFVVPEERGHVRNRRLTAHKAGQPRDQAGHCGRCTMRDLRHGLSLATGRLSPPRSGTIPRGSAAMARQGSRPVLVPLSLRTQRHKPSVPTPPARDSMPSRPAQTAYSRVFCLTQPGPCSGRCATCPKWVWAILCLGLGLSIPWGGILYLSVGKVRHPKPPHSSRAVSA